MAIQYSDEAERLTITQLDNLSQADSVRWENDFEGSRGPREARRLRPLAVAAETMAFATTSPY